MPVSLSELKNQRAEVVADLGIGEPVTVIYNPGKWTFDLTEGLNEALRKAEEGTEEERRAARPWLIGFLLEIGLGFDMPETPGDPTPIPWDEPNLKRIPIPALAAMSRAISEDAVPNPTGPRGSNSGARSRPAVGTHPSPPGIA